jgi:GntR family transcriptional regulator
MRTKQITAEPSTNLPAGEWPAHRLARRDGPLYRQLGQILRQDIASGRLAVGDTLPTEAQLTNRFGVSLITVRQALRDLEADGLIRKRAAKTAIVVSGAPRMRLSAHLNSLADFVELTRDARLNIRSWRSERSNLAARTFGLAPATHCHCLRGVLVVGDQREAEITIYFPPAIGNNLARADFDDVVVFRSVQRRLGLRYGGARVTVRAETADRRLAELLGYTEGSAILVNEMLFSAVDGKPMELTIARHRADLYSLTYDLNAGPP